MLDLTDKTMSSLLSSMLLRISEQVNKRDGSLIKTALSAAAWAIEGLYIELLYVQSQAFATSASGDYLDLKVAERGLTRLPATKEICILKCNLSTLPLEFQFGDSSGYTWEVTSGIISGPDSEGLYAYQITCQTSGEIAEPEGDLRALSFLAGLVTAKFGDVISPGKNQETDERLRDRYKESLVEIAFAGNISAYREKMLSLEYKIGTSGATIGGLQVYPCTDMNGDIKGGNVKIWILNSDLEVASSELVAAVQNEICPMYNGVVTGFGNGFAPIGAAVHIATATSTPTLTIEVQIEYSGTDVDRAISEIKHNIRTYVATCMMDWGKQVKTPYDTATISIKEAFIYSASIVSGVKDVRSVALKKDGIIQDGTASWITDRKSMEWIILDDIIIDVLV